MEMKLVVTRKRRRKELVSDETREWAWPARMRKWVTVPSSGAGEWTPHPKLLYVFFLLSPEKAHF